MLSILFVVPSFPHFTPSANVPLCACQAMMLCNQQCVDQQMCSQSSERRPPLIALKIGIDFWCLLFFSLLLYLECQTAFVRFAFA